MPPIHILIVDDDERFRKSLRNLLVETPDIIVIGEVENGKQGIRMAEKLKPDVVLMDIRMPEMDGLAATRLLKKEMPEIRVIIISISDEKEYQNAALEAGAVGYIEKKTINGNLIPAIKEACPEKLQTDKF